MVRFEDYPNGNGGTDWEAYQRAKVAVGEACSKCGAYLLFAKGYRDECGSCRSLADDANPVTHASSVRCPKCRHAMDVNKSELFDLYQDGEHEVSCSACDHEFEVSTHVSFTFTSPALLPEDGSERGEEEEEVS